MHNYTILGYPIICSMRNCACHLCSSADGQDAIGWCWWERQESTDTLPSVSCWVHPTVGWLCRTWLVESWCVVALDRSSVSLDREARRVGSLVASTRPTACELFEYLERAKDDQLPPMHHSLLPKYSKARQDNVSNNERNLYSCLSSKTLLFEFES